MACYHPHKGYFSPFPNASGKFPFVFDKSASGKLPCGQCIGCRLDRSRKSAMRCMHEASLYDFNCFITLTYSEENLPPFGALVKSDLQKFFKRLRKRYGKGIRYYACGEYGEQFGRPHFHACVFNHDFHDKVLFKVRNGINLYTSDSLSSLWNFGFATVGALSFESAAYVARYCMKKITGLKAETHYTRLVPETGELVCVPPEFACMSLKPGIGKPWLDRYMTDVYPSDFVVMRGVKMKPPRYYDDQYAKDYALELENLKRLRLDGAYERRSDSTPERLKVREKVTRSKMSLFSKREL